MWNNCCKSYSRWQTDWPTHFSIILETLYGIINEYFWFIKAWQISLWHYGWISNNSQPSFGNRKREWSKWRFRVEIKTILIFSYIKRCSCWRLWLSFYTTYLWSKRTNWRWKSSNSDNRKCSRLCWFSSSLDLPWKC